MRISVVIPALNEAGNIGRLIQETYAAAPDRRLGEVIVVDDCSDDGTGAEVRALRSTHPTLRYLRHDVRAGQSAALRSGILAALFPVVVTMDGDGQNDPADIAGLLERLGPLHPSSPALVGGIRLDRKAKGSKRLASLAANWIRNAILGDDCPDTGCGLKAFRREAFLRLPYFSGMHRYLPALFLAYGHRVDYAPVMDRPRLAGQTKYTNLSRALIGLYDLVGVTWLRRRTVLPPVSEDAAVQPSPAAARKSGAAVASPSDGRSSGV